METKSDFTIIPKKKRRGRSTSKPTVKQLAKDYASLSTKEVAEKYGVKEATVRTWVYRARRGMY